MKYDVTVDRDKYIGGSDIPIIFGISPFKTRWQLLLEKAEPAKYGPANIATTREIEYGNEMEPVIRDYVNEIENTWFMPDQKIIDDLRANTDGWDGKTILEIKTTSHISHNISGYKHYLVQLLFYMMIYGTDEGILAVYKRPDDFSTEFDEERLQIFYVDLQRNEELCREIARQIEQFRIDLERVKENPLLTEQDLQPKAVIEAANWVLSVEKHLEFYQHIEQEYKAAKQLLKQQMDKYGIKRWITNNGTKITLVPDGEDTVVKELDTQKLKADMPEIFADDSEYMVEKIKKGRSGYVKITPP